jgi:hypothetical protein
MCSGVADGRRTGRAATISLHRGALNGIKVSIGGLLADVVTCLLVLSVLFDFYLSLGWGF